MEPQNQIVGIVAHIGDYRMDGVKYNVYSVEYGKTYYCIAPPHWHIEEGDVISFIGGTKVIGTGRFLNVELYVLGRDFTISFIESNEVVYQIMLKVMKSIKLTDLLYEELENDSNGSPISNILYKVSEERKDYQIFKWWLIHRVCRRLWLLGLNNDSIEKNREYYRCSIAELYNKIVENPLTALPISIGEAVKLCTRLGIDYTKEDITVATIARYIYAESAERKHSYITIKKLKANWGVAPEFYDQLRTTHNIVITEEYAQLKYNAEAEEGLALMLCALSNNKVTPVTPVYQDNVELDKHQIKAISTALNQPISIICGGPGRGKTYIMKQIIYNLTRLNIEYLIICPTGKATDRARELTGDKEHAMTADMLIKSTSPTIKHILWDESSMTTTSQAYEVIKKMGKNVRYTFIGDPNQLQPIKWGQFFHCLLDTKMFPTVRLIKNYRAKNAVYVLNKNDEVVESEHCIMEEGEIVNLIKHYVELINSGVRAHTISILTPLRVDVERINKQCQSLNPSTKYIVDANGRKFAVNDKVVLKQNQYNIERWNGNIGIVIDVDKKGKCIFVEFNGDSEKFIVPSSPGVGKEFEYYKFNLNDLTTDKLDLAYCLTVHSAQGDEWPYTMFYVDKGPRKNVDFYNFYMMNTALSRAERKSYIIGDVSSVQKYIKILPPPPLNRLNTLIKEYDGTESE